MTLLLPDEAAYRAHYNLTYTRSSVPLHTSIGTAPVYFERETFDHAFYDRTDRHGEKDHFSLVRARRMDDIATVLASPTADRRAGWDKQRRSHDHTRCVSLAIDDFVVIVRLGLNRNGFLKGRFITCYVADNSIGKIRTAPAWNEARCVQLLSQRKEKGR